MQRQSKNIYCNCILTASDSNWVSLNPMMSKLFTWLEEACVTGLFDSLPTESEAMKAFAPPRLLGPAWALSFARREASSASLLHFNSRYLSASADVRQPAALASCINWNFHFVRLQHSCITRDNR